MTALRSLTNRLDDCQLLDLARLLRTPGGHGPYLLVQDGCDPADPRQRHCSFVLTRRGTWLHYYLYLALPEDVRRRCALFEKGHEALEQVAGMGSEVRVEDTHSIQELLRDHGFEPDPSDFTGQVLLERLRSTHPNRPSHSESRSS